MCAAGGPGSRPFLDGSLVFYLNGMYRQYGPEGSAVDAFHGYGGFEFTYGSSSAGSRARATARRCRTGT